MNCVKLFSTATAVLALTASAFAQSTVIVNSTLPPAAGRYQTITAALDHLSVENEPRVINITGGGPYHENISANFSVTIRGQNYRPVIVTPPTSGMINSNLNDVGVTFFTTAAYPGPQTFRLENLVLIPDQNNPPLHAIRTNNNASGLTTDDMHVFLDNVLITSNNGNDEPVSEDGLTEADMTGATTYRDDMIWIYGYTNLTMTNTIITNAFGSTVSADGIVFWPDGVGYKLTLNEGCVISYTNRMGIQMVVGSRMLEVRGTPENPVVFKGNRNGPTAINPAIAIFGAAGTLADNYIIENAVFVENNGPAISQGTVTAPGTAIGIDFNNVAFVNNDGPAVAIGGDLKRAYTFTNVTMVGNGGGTGHVPSAMVISQNNTNGTDGSVTFIDSIVAGRGAVGTGTTNNNVVHITAPLANVTFQNSALVTDGPYELAGNGYFLANGVSTPPTFTNVVNSDPGFVEVGADFTSDEFLAVSSGAYATAGTGGDPLTGYGLWMPNASVDGWMLY